MKWEERPARRPKVVFNFMFLLYHTSLSSPILIYQTSYRLTALCNSFKVDVSVIGGDKDDWVTSFNMFSQAKYRDSKRNRINTIPGSNADSVDINQWILERTGYSLNVRPKRDKWLDYISDIGRT